MWWACCVAWSRRKGCGITQALLVPCAHCERNAKITTKGLVKENMLFAFSETLGDFRQNPWRGVSNQAIKMLQVELYSVFFYGWAHSHSRSQPVWSINYSDNKYFIFSNQNYSNSSFRQSFRNEGDLLQRGVSVPWHSVWALGTPVSLWKWRWMSACSKYTADSRAQPSSSQRSLSRKWHYLICHCDILKGCIITLTVALGLGDMTMKTEMCSKNCLDFFFFFFLSFPPCCLGSTAAWMVTLGRKVSKEGEK